MERWTVLLLVAVGFAALAAACWLRVVFARLYLVRRAKERLMEVDLFWGLTKLIAWEANQGLVLLRFKRLSQTIYGPRTGGGMRLIYPILGQELRVRAPLTTHLAEFRDERILTRDGIQVTLKLGIFWQITDLEKYYFAIDKEVNAYLDHEVQQCVEVTTNADSKLATAGVWVKSLTESCSREVVSHTTIAELVSTRPAQYLNVQQRLGPAADQVATGPRPPTIDVNRNTNELLAARIRELLVPKVSAYGLGVERIEVLEIQLPPTIQQAIDRVLEKSLLPAQVEQEALAETIRLREQASVLGQEAVVVREVAKHLPSGDMLGATAPLVQALVARLAPPAASHRPPAQAALPGHPAQPPNLPAPAPATVPLDRKTPQPEPVERLSHCCGSCGKPVALPAKRAAARQWYRCPHCAVAFADPRSSE